MHSYYTYSFVCDRATHVHGFGSAAQIELVLEKLKNLKIHKNFENFRKIAMGLEYISPKLKELQTRNFQGRITISCRISGPKTNALAPGIKKLLTLNFELK